MVGTESASWNVFFTIDGLVQVGGLMMIIAARLFPEEVYVKEGWLTRLPVLPTAGPAGRGLGLATTF
jgi:hypothetical protein